MGNPNIPYAAQKNQIEKASNMMGIFLIIAIIAIVIGVYFHGNNNGWWENESEKEFGVDLSQPARDKCGMISMECGIDESSSRYRFHSGRFNEELDPKWKSPQINGTGKTTVLCNPETFECSPNIHGCAPALNCDNNTCGIEKQSIVNNIYENGQGDYSSPSVDYNRFNGRPLYNSQWNTIAEEQYFGFNCVDSEEGGPINSDWFNRCLLLLDEENYDRYTDTINKDNNNKDPGSEKFKNIKKCETYLNMSYKDTNNANFDLKKNIILREMDNYKKNGVDKKYVNNIKQFKPRSINDILINQQQDIINSFYLNKDIVLTEEEEKSLSNILNKNNDIKSTSSINQIKSLQSDTIDTDEPMENIWGQSGSTNNSLIETYTNNGEEEEEEEEIDNNNNEEEEEEDLDNDVELNELNTTPQSCKIEGPGCDLPKCGWEYTFVAQKEVSIHECTKKLYWSQAGPYGMVPYGEDELVEDMTLPISSIGTDSNTGAPLEFNENNIFPGSRKEGNLDSYSVNAQDSRAYNKIPAQFATCEYINNYKYDENSKKWQFQDDSGNNISTNPGGEFNPVDGAGKPITDIKDLCNMSASLRVNKVINPDTYYNEDRLPIGGRGFASDLEAIDRQISNTGSTVVAGCKWYEGNGEIPSQCIQEGMDGLIEQDNTKPLYEKWCILDPGSDLIDLPVYEYPSRDNPNPDWSVPDTGDTKIDKSMFGGIDPWINPPLEKRDFGSCSGGAGLGLSSQNEPRQGPFCNKDVDGALVNSDGTVNCPGVRDLKITGVGKWISPENTIIDSEQGVFDWSPVPVAPLICTNPYKFGSRMSNSDVCAWDFSSATNNGIWWRSFDNPKMASGIQGSTTGLGSSHCPDPRYPHPVIVKDGNCNCNNCVSCCNKYDSLGWQQEDADSLGDNLMVGIGRNYPAVWAEPVSIPQRGDKLKRWQMGGKDGSESWNRAEGQRQLASGVTKNTGVAYSRPPYSPWLQSTSSNMSCVLEQAGCTDSICAEKNGELLYDTGDLCAKGELMSDDDPTNYINWGRVERDDIITANEGVFTRAIDSPGPSDYGTGDESPTVYLRNFKYPNMAFINSEKKTEL